MDEQNVRTAGVDDTMTSPGLLNRVLIGVLSWAGRLNWKHAKFGNHPFMDIADFPWTADLEREWTVIRAELDGVMTRKNELSPFQDILTGARSISTDRDWKTFMLKGYGVPTEAGDLLCPNTRRVLETIPGMKTALFSVLEPGKELKPHRGPYNGVLRLHLALLVPDAPPGAIGLRVRDEVRYWEEGKVLIFDDTFEHDAWNRSAETRVVLFVDIVKPLHFPASLVNWAVLRIAPFTPFIRDGVRAQKKWEATFFRNAKTG